MANYFDDDVSKVVVTQLQGRKSTDDRGSVSFVNDFDPNKYGIRRFYVVKNHKAGFIRAWHGHLIESKFVYVVRGAALIKLVPLNKRPPDTGFKISIVSHVLSSDDPQVLCVPPGYFNGFKSLTDDTVIMFFSDKTVEESKGDDIRQPWDHFGSDVWWDNYR